MQEAIRKLIHGFRAFQATYFAGDRTLFNALCYGQHPKILVIACSDSRVDPALLTNCDPGDLFVIRNVANLVPPYEPDTRHHGVSAALEYAVRSLAVEHIVVLGHSNCGGIRTLMEQNVPTEPGEFLGSWLALAQPAKQEVLRRLANEPFQVQVQACEEAALLLSLDNLCTFPWVKSGVESGRLALHGWYFNLENGQLFRYDPERGQFTALDASSAEGDSQG